MGKLQGYSYDDGMYSERCNKMTFASRKAAKRRMHIVALQKQNRQPGKKMRAYYCDRCQGWHYGHLPYMVQRGLMTVPEWYSPEAEGELSGEHR